MPKEKNITDKKEAIFEAMLRLITTRGIHATPMSKVAREAGVAAGTIYHHFESKEALLNELYVHLKTHLGEALMAETNPAMTFKEQFFFKWESLFNYFINNPLSFVFAEQVVSSPIISKEARELGEQQYAPVVAFFGMGIESGVLRPMNLQLMTSMVYSNVVTLVGLQLGNKLEVTESILREAVTSSWDSIVKKE